MLEAKASATPVLVEFGANLCGDCKVLHQAFKSGERAPLIRKHFRVIKVDVGRIDRNVDIAQAYGVPLKKGNPAVAILSPQGQVVYATKSGELADARNIGVRGTYEFLARKAVATR